MRCPRPCSRNILENQNDMSKAKVENLGGDAYVLSKAVSCLNVLSPF